MMLFGLVRQTLSVLLFPICYQYIICRYLIYLMLTKTLTKKITCRIRKLNSFSSDNLIHKFPRLRV